MHITSDIEPRMPAGAAFLIDELVAFEAGLEPLTSLYSAPLFGEIAEGRFSEARRHGFVASLLLVDIDDFDCIRDRHGRLVADAAMLAVAELLRNRLRREDMVALRDGGTFQVLLMHCDGTGALAKAEALRAAIAGLAPAGIPITASIGLASAAVSAGLSFDMLMERAGEALGTAWARGPDHVVAHTRPHGRPAAGPTPVN